MKFGKRRQEIQVPGVPGVTIPAAKPKGTGLRRNGGGSEAPPASSPVTDSWTGAPADPPPPPTMSAPPEEPAEPAAQGEALGYAEPVVDGEAVELPPVIPATPIYEPLEPLTLQGVSSLGDSGDAFASGHAAAPGPSWQEPLMALADERPELAVGAAFAGGILVAMILRRLGN